MPIAQPLRHAWRSLRRTPAFTVTAVLTLAIGIGATAALFAVVNGVLLRPLPYGDPDRLVGAWHDLPGVNIAKANQTSGTYFTYQRFAQTVESVGIWQESAVNLAEPGGAGEPQRVTAAFLTATVIPTLKVSPLVGRNFTEAEDVPDGPRVVMISEGLWRARFGRAPDVVGRTIEVNGLAREIVGVMPERFRFPTRDTRLWLPLGLDARATFSGGFNYEGVARLKPGVPLDAAERELAAVLPRVAEVFPDLAPGIPTKMLLEQVRPRPFLVPLRQDVTGSIARTLWIVATAAGLVLLVACANVANLVLVRADARQRELAVREALGAGRARVLAHFLAESALLAAMAGTIGLLMAWIAVRMLVAAGPADIPRLAELAVDAPTFLFTLVVAAVVALVCSAVPALRIGRAPLASALREGGRGGTAGRAQHRLRASMVAVQIALALVVLSGSGLLLRTFQRLNAVRPGFESDRVATLWMSLPRARYANDSAVVRFWTTLTERVAALPGVQSVGLSSRLPLLGWGMNQNPFYAEDDPTALQKVPPLQIYTVADAGYFRAMGIPLIAGRAFERTGIQRNGEAIISLRTAVQFWKDSTGQAALGKRFRSLPTAPWHTVVGVVGDARDTSLAAPPSQTVYFPVTAERDTMFAQGQRTMALAVRTPGEPTAVTGAVQRLVRELDPTLPTFAVRPMSAVMRGSMAQLSFTIVMLGAAAVVTLLLGAIGLYGVMAYLVTLRTRELGVRIALGASPGTVAAMMTKQGLLLTAAGVGAGLVLFAVVARFLRAFLYGVAPGDPLTLAAASLALVGVALLASWIPARRAARVDPAESLRAE